MLFMTINFLKGWNAAKLEIFLINIYIYIVFISIFCVCLDLISGELLCFCLLTIPLNFSSKVVVILKYFESGKVGVRRSDATEE